MTHTPAFRQASRPQDTEPRTSPISRELAGRWLHAALPMVAALGLIAGALCWFVLRRHDVAEWIFLLTLVLGGFPVVFQTLRHGLKGNFATDVVASLAILGAAATGEFAAGCIIVLMQTGGEWLEEFAARRASASLEALLNRAPRVAHRYRGAELEVVPVEEVRVDDRVLVRPGEIVPVDGIIAAGTSLVDESALTGEPVPRTCQPGEEVMSGSVALDGALELRTIRPSSDSQYERIVRLVEAAQRDKAPIGRLADRYAVFFTPFTLLMCITAYLVTRSWVAVVAVLVVATPCPLILATPVAIISGINRAARFGIIVKGGTAIERVGQADAVIFDKTGTLTKGAPVVERVVPLDGCSENELLRLAAGLEQYSTHPMARALVAAAVERGMAVPEASQVKEKAGQGVSGVSDGHTVDVGSFAHAAEQGLASPEALSTARELADARDDAMAVIGVDRKAAGLVVYADPLRPAVPGMLRRLSELGVRETAMLTGDDAATAGAIASAAGLTSVRSQLLPAQKVDAVKESAQRYRTVVMVGDGINDAPALAAATVGIAMGARGSAIAAETADIVLTTDDIGRVADAVSIGRRTLHIARQSIWIGLGVSSALMVVAASGNIQPAIGALLQEVLDVAVIVNALRAR
ncbi:MAG TPA: heavy metal translocating P-type ATPase [Chloroflexota bacterium]|nr:heavy metal translocating P-type ATPase [Chloroflexota bacterium]